MYCASWDWFLCRRQPQVNVVYCCECLSHLAHVTGTTAPKMIITPNTADDVRRRRALRTNNGSGNHWIAVQLVQQRNCYHKFDQNTDYDLCEHWTLDMHKLAHWTILPLGISAVNHVQRINNQKKKTQNIIVDRNVRLAWTHATVPCNLLWFDIHYINSAVISMGDGTNGQLLHGEPRKWKACNFTAAIRKHVPSQPTRYQRKTHANWNWFLKWICPQQWTSNGAAISLFAKKWSWLLDRITSDPCSI